MKAIALVSGGLDSILAARLVRDLGIEVLGLNFVAPFCTCTSRGCQHAAKKVGDQLGIPMKVVRLDREYIELVRHPRHGYGRNLNPCLDCRILIFRKAREYMAETGARFIFTGEVLGERPMSQHRAALALIEREADLAGLVLRPLSARLLGPTIPEQQGWVDREQLLAISGRSRRPQIALAAQYGINDYPCPAGGCLLTDPIFARRLKELFDHGRDDLNSIQLLKYGRHFRLPDGGKVVVGRREHENAVIAALAKPDDLLFIPVDVPGPTALLRGDGTNGVQSAPAALAAALCARYSDHTDDAPVRVRIFSSRAPELAVVDVRPARPDELESLRIS